MLVSTLDGIDYHFEPPMLWVLSALLSMKALQPEVASILLQLHLHEDLLLESVLGRKANLRPGDDSLVLKSINWTELLSRWQNIHSRDDAISYISDRHVRLAIKMPSVINAIPFFETALSESRFLVIIRDGRDVVKSIIKKMWFSDEGLENNFWPYKVVDGKKAPHLVEDSMVGEWSRMNEATRACYLWRRDAEFALHASDNGMDRKLYILTYEDLRRYPDRIMKEIAKFLSTRTTDLTKLGTMSVRPMTNKKLSGNKYGFLSVVDAKELIKFNEINAIWGYSD